MISKWSNDTRLWSLTTTKKVIKVRDDNSDSDNYTAAATYENLNDPDAKDSD